MIPEVDEALRRLVREEAVPDESVAVAFDAPTRDWSARRGGPVVNLYLHEVREDVAARTSGRVREPVAGPGGTSWRPPSVMVRMGYLLTCWTARPEDEHRLLAACLLGLLRHPVVPPRLLPTGVAGVGPGRVDLLVARPEGDARKSASLWQALGGELKPSLDLQVLVPVDLGLRYPAGPPVSQPVVLDVERLEGPVVSASERAGSRERVAGRSPQVPG